VLESTIALALLRRERCYPEAQAGLLRFIATRQADPDLNAVERTLAEASLGLADSPVGKREPFGGFTHHTSSRKQLMLGTYLAVLGAAPYPELDASFDYRGQASWAELGMCSIKILNADGRGQPEMATSRDREFLVRGLESARREVWEGNAAAHLLALLALRTLDQDNQLVADGIDAALGVRNADGGMPFLPDHTIYLGAVAGLAMARCDGDRNGSLLTRIGDYLTRHQNPDNGWAFTERVWQNDVDSTGAVIEFLQAVDSDRYAEPVAWGREYLATMANPDGGFPTYLRSQPSEAVMTANAVTALAPAWHHYADLLDKAARHLLQAQKTDGTFERSWSLSEAHAIRRVVTALTCLPEHTRTPLRGDIERALRLANSYLENTQNPDGGFGQQAGDESDPISTAHSISAGTALGKPPWHRRALAYLLQQQHPDGGFHSKTDQVGPRPIPYDFPSLANIFALTALAEGLYV
jgi:prenyltransferase beta subunit